MFFDLQISDQGADIQCGRVTNRILSSNDTLISKNIINLRQSLQAFPTGSNIDAKQKCIKTFPSSFTQFSLKFFELACLF